MIRVAFPIIGGRGWTGGYNYLLNLVRVCQTYAPGRIHPIIFFGLESEAEERAPFEAIPGVEVVVDEAFSASGRSRRIAEALLTGLDRSGARALAAHEADIVFEAAQFFGWRLKVPAIAWIPDFQHRHLPHLFSAVARLRRSIGFNAQIVSGRTVMLSSEDARKDCERYHPLSRGRTAVVRFAIPPARRIDAETATECAKRYGLPLRFFFLPNQFWVHKNHEVVIEALAILAARGDAPVVAASGGQVDPRVPGHFERLMGRAEALGVADKFRPLGLVPYGHIALLMRSAQALINPSLFEGWSTTVEEARTSGAPMILSDLGVHLEQAREENALFFDPNDPHALAAQMEGMVLLDAAAREASATDGAHRSLDRARGFARSFCDLVERSVAR